jgi:hypothetical protein
MGILRKLNRRNIKIPKLKSGKTVAPKMPKKPTAKKLQATMPKIPSFSRGPTKPGSSGIMKTSAPAAKKSPQAKKPLMATPIEPNNVGKKKVKKGPGFKDGGAVNKRKATGAATRGFGKAYMKGKR